MDRIEPVVTPTLEQGGEPMISLTRFSSGERIAINPDLIERIEEIPDTVVTMTNGNRAPNPQGPKLCSSVRRRIFASSG